MSTEQRLILISNRLPVTVKPDGSITPSAGGLATGLHGPHERSGGVWIGWPGDTSALEEKAAQGVAEKLAEMRCVPIDLSKEEVEQFYEGFSNRILWPFMHYLIDKLPYASSDWPTYCDVNRKFADAAVAAYRPGDIIWVHDYQLCLVPAMIREKLPGARIGFFLHIPFPNSDVFRILPWRVSILEGLLGADLIGFHTFSYVRNFMGSLLHLLGLSGSMRGLFYQGREISVGAYPMGIDAEVFATEAASPEVEKALEERRTGARPDQITVLGIDRLDYTKGIIRRLLAIDSMLKAQPELRGRLKYIQVAVPSRESVDQYAQLRKQVEELVSRVNGRYGTHNYTPISYLYQSFSRQELVTMYREADIMLVTPLRDGMNLVAKEYVASRIDDNGVLVLSELAGAASELGEALLINPYDTEGIADAITRGIYMEAEEKRVRCAAMRARVHKHNVHKWASRFITDLGRSSTMPIGVQEVSSDADLTVLKSRCFTARRLIILLDYDGTLVPHVSLPELARPDPRLMALLERLSQRPNTDVHLVTGRKRENVVEWFGRYTVGMHAEHGLWSRAMPTSEAPEPSWVCAIEDPTSLRWKEAVRQLLNEFTERTPGAFVEEKTASLAWHYRQADSEFGALQANELQLHLQSMVSNFPVEVLPGSKVVEVRQQGITKGTVTRDIMRGMDEDTVVIAFGDDRTDEDMFGVLPSNAMAVKVGPGHSVAQYRVRDYLEVRALLRVICADAECLTSPHTAIMADIASVKRPGGTPPPPQPRPQEQNAQGSPSAALDPYFLELEAEIANLRPMGGH